MWAGAKGDDPQVVAAARTAMIAETEDEYRRLLYVAMTRAADRLIVGGTMPANRKEVRENSWYDLIAKGLENSGLDMQQVPPPDGVVKRYTRGPLPDLQGITSAAVEPSPPALPDWLRAPARPGIPTRTAIRPSDADDVWHRIRAKDDTNARAQALLRGTMTHRLLQSLPDIPAPRRAAAAQDFLARNAPQWSSEARHDLAGRTLALIDDPRFASVFAPGSRAEVPIVGRLVGIGRCAAPGFGPDRPPRGDAAGCADRRLQDRPGGGRAAGKATSASSPFTAQCWRGSIPAGRSARRCCGRKPLKSLRLPADTLDAACGRSSRRDVAGLRWSRTGPNLTRHGSVPTFTPSRRDSLAPHFQSTRTIMAVGKVSDADFESEVLKAQGPVVVDFWAEWCGPCRMIAPALDEISGAMGEKVKIVKLNVDENPQTASKYGVMSIPTLMIFKGGEMASRQVGAAPKQKLQQWISAAV